MSASIIDGFAIAANLRAEIAEAVTALKEKGVQPALAVILVGNNPASQSYVKGKTKALHEVGMEDKTFRLPEETSQAELVKLIHELNTDKTVNGILVQLPLPKQIDADAVIAAIDPAKDVDGFHPQNVGELFLGRKTFVPCTPQGVVYLLEKTGVQTKGAHAVVIGRSAIVGKPLSSLLVDRKVNCTVTTCHSATKNLSEITRQADILIAAIGSPKFVTGNMIKPGAVVIDVGVNRVEDASKKNGFRLVGDVDFDAAKEIASAITPVPRGVGPMTIAMLLENTLLAARIQAGLE